MYNHRNCQYILKQSSGKIWNFFHDEKHGICCSTMTRRNTWTEPMVLQKNAHSSFYVDLDYEDCFHIFFQDKSGNMLYLFMENENIKVIPVLNSRTNAVYNKYFYLLPLKNNIQLFYTIEHNEQLILAHQAISNGSPGNPRVIDYVIRSDIPYTVVTDRTGSIYVFYQASDGKYLQLGYKKYIPGRKYWSEFIPVTRYNGDCELPHLICDINNVLHMCYQRRSERQFELVYQQKTPDRNIWSEETVITSSGYTFSNCAILFANDKLVIYWVRENIIYFSSSSNNGITWTRPERLNFSTGRQLFCFCYKTNYPYENDKIISREIPGNFINGITLAFYQDSSSNIYNLSAEELRTMIIDTLKLLKINIEEIRETISDLKANLNELKVAQQHLEKEVAKYSIRMALAEGSYSGTNRNKAVRNHDYKSMDLSDEQALELMKAEFLTENKADLDNTDYNIGYPDKNALNHTAFWKESGKAAKVNESRKDQTDESMSFPDRSDQRDPDSKPEEK